MLIPLHQLPMSKVTGIIHVGAHTAEELQGYLLCGIRDIAWIEANPALIKHLNDTIAPYNRMMVGNFAAGSSTGKIDLNIANNGESSSVLEMGTHKDVHPGISYIGKTTVDLLRIDDWIESRGMSRPVYNFINLDIQGYELEALKGAVKQLQYVDFVYTEINVDPLYLNCAMIDLVDAFLRDFGFSRLTTAVTPYGWGDAFYFKASPPDA